MIVLSYLRPVFSLSARQIARFTSTNVCPNEFQFKSNYSSEEQQKILSIINESNAEELSRYDMSQARIKNLDMWRTKNGPFVTLHEILEVEGLGENVLDKLCKSIIFNRSTDKVVSTAKNRRQVLTPQLDSLLANSLQDAVGIHLAPTGVSWSKMDRGSNLVQSWNYIDFMSVPKKLTPTDIFQMSVSILNKLPIGEVYVMESSQSAGPQNSNMKQAPTYTQQIELSSMLLALLNTNNKHAINMGTQENPSYENNVYYLRSNLPARMFRTFVGNERVSTTGIVKQLLDKDDSLPCSTVEFQDNLKEYYFSQSASRKDLLGQSLMLVITFMNLCIYRNPNSLAAIAPGRSIEI
ncbi:PREDICTED: transcription elongation factor, mitochondrial isoform X2 [Nicrophorus vespilloides]|uniref:Transcription elongation factor, mitochondrial isoform X2 n=1 Tax=Nicrophorus vespilloides TaxID=110193 RepID=A0ABM1M9C8_NICVS|nr:PREDICTED: transcription elongation factor, mitochondrial isoform X2 [Nicrophorus vespilloides]